MELVNIGRYANSNDGDSIRDSFSKINDNFTEVTTTLETLSTGVSDTQIILDGKQDTLVSGVNLRTLNGESILGSGNVEIILSSLTDEELRASPVPVVDTLCGAIGEDIKVILNGVADSGVIANDKIDNLISILTLTNQYVDNIESLLSNDGQQDAALLPLLNSINANLVAIGTNTEFTTDIVDGINTLSAKLPPIIGRLAANQSLSVVFAEGEISSFSNIIPKGQKNSAESVPVVLASDSQLSVSIDGSSIATEDTLLTLKTELLALLGLMNNKLPSIGQKTKSDSVSVVMASDAVLPVTIQDASIDVNVSNSFASEDTLLSVKAEVSSVGSKLDSLSSKIPGLGQTTKDGSISVVLASDDTITVDNLSGVETKIEAVANKIPQLGQKNKDGSLPVVIAGDNGLASESTLLDTLTALSSINTKTPTVGQKNSTGSVPVVLASDHAPLSVSVAEITNADIASETTLSSLNAKLPTIGQHPKSNSVSVVMASDSSLAVSVDNLSGLALDTSVNAVKSSIDALRSDFNGKIPSVGQKTGNNSIPVVLASDTNLSVTVGDIGSGASDASVISVGQKIDAVGAKIPTLGQKTKSGSLPVTLASDDGIALDTSVISVKASVDATKTVIDTLNTKTPSLGVKTSANSSPVVIASDQAAIPVTFGEGTSINVNVGNTDLAKETTLQTSNNKLTSINASLLSIDGKLPVKGEHESANSVSVVLAYDHSVIDVKQVELNYSYSYSWDADGNLSSESRMVNGSTETRTYSWDSNGNLTNISAWSLI